MSTNSGNGFAAGGTLLGLMADPPGRARLHDRAAVQLAGAGAGEWAGGRASGWMGGGEHGRGGYGHSDVSVGAEARPQCWPGVSLRWSHPLPTSALRRGGKNATQLR